MSSRKSGAQAGVEEALDCGYAVISLALMV